MPKIPTYDSPQVGSAPLPGFTVPTDTSGQALQQLGQGALAAGNSMLVKARIEQEEENLTAVAHSAAEFEAGYLAVVNEAQTRTGQDVLPLREDTQKWWNDSATKYKGALGNDAQRAAFDKMITARWPHFTAAIDGHVRTEKKKMAITSAAELMGTSTEAMSQAARGGDAAAIALHRDTLIRGAQALAKLQGSDPAILQEKALGSAHGAVVQSLLSTGSLDAAKGYFYINIKEIPHDIRVSLEPKLAKTSSLAAEQALAAQYMAQNLSEMDTVAAARKGAPPEYQDKVIERIKTQFQERADAKKEADAAQIEPWSGILSDAITRNKPIPASQIDAANQALLAYDPDVALKVVSAMRAHNDDFKPKGDGGMSAAQRRDQISAARWLQLRDQAVDSPEEFLRTNLAIEKDLTPSDKKSLQVIREKLKTPEGKYEEATLTQQITKSLDEVEIKDKDVRAKFERVARDRMRANKDEARTEEGRQKIIDHLLEEGEARSGKWYLPDRDMRRFEAVDQGKTDTFVPDNFKGVTRLQDVPKAYRDSIKARARKGGRIATPQEIVRTYNDMMQKGQ